MAISSQDADKFRLKHREELLALFEAARGCPARTTDELAQWLDSVDDDLADGIAREVAEEAGRKAGREAAKQNGREASSANILRMNSLVRTGPCPPPSLDRWRV
jgi:hypothetical protein